MRIGDIVRNDWASDKNPIRFFIYTGIKGKYAFGICVTENGIEETRYYKEDVETDKFVVVGRCEYQDLIKKDLRQARGE